MAHVYNTDTEDILLCVATAWSHGSSGEQHRNETELLIQQVLANLHNVPSHGCILEPFPNSPSTKLHHVLQKHAIA